jgi:O-antigen ligase
VEQAKMVQDAFRPTQEPNTLGGYLVLMTAITMGLYFTSISGRGQIFCGLLAFLFVIPLFYTQSRSSYAATLPVIMVFVWLSEKRHWVIIGVLLLGISLPFIAPKAAKDRIIYTFTQGEDRQDVVEIRGERLDTSTSARLRNWKEASSDWIKHPILGFGMTGYGLVDTQYIRVMTETGFIGLLTFFLLMYTLFRQTYVIFKEATKPFYRGLSMGFLAGFVGMLFHSIGANTFIIVRIMEPFLISNGYGYHDSENREGYMIKRASSTSKEVISFRVSQSHI